MWFKIEGVIYKVVWEGEQWVLRLPVYGVTICGPTADDFRANLARLVKDLGVDYEAL